METNADKLLYPELSYKIVGLCFDTHNELGRFAREKQYADVLEKEFEDNHIKYQSEFKIGDSGNIADFLVDNKIILELKTTRSTSRSHFRQLQNYLQQSRFDLGILINFSDKYLNPKRVLRIKD